MVGITGCGSDTTQVQPVVTFDHGSESNFAVAIRGLLTEDSRRLAATAGGSNVKLWDVETGEEELTLHGHEGRVIGLDFSPNGRLLASASLDNTVRLFDFFSDHWCLTLRGYDSHVNSVAFSSDGKRLASGSDSKTVRVQSIVLKETNWFVGEESEKWLSAQMVRFWLRQAMTRQ